jgi:hypothetical protein
LWKSESKSSTKNNLPLLLVIVARPSHSFFFFIFFLNAATCTNPSSFFVTALKIPAYYNPEEFKKILAQREWGKKHKKQLEKNKAMKRRAFNESPAAPPPHCPACST